MRTLAYGNTVPGTTIRANVGDEVAVALTNGLDHETSVHLDGNSFAAFMEWAHHPTRSGAGDHRETPIVSRLLNPQSRAGVGKGSAYGITNHSRCGCQGILIAVAARGVGTAPSRFVVAEEMPGS
ncbi:multicopper oxidase domain-containing protein [Rhodococcus opacus]|uniref:multicopper oxidase domain-containing protein n=1 Tax=Rhodococcus opacus TaxID=37919 RepID=UPI003D66329A